jgi:hypothetical protein
MLVKENFKTKEDCIEYFKKQANLFWLNIDKPLHGGENKIEAIKKFNRDIADLIELRPLVRISTDRVSNTRYIMVITGDKNNIVHIISEEEFKELQKLYYREYL